MRHIGRVSFLGKTIERPLLVAFFLLNFERMSQVNQIVLFDSFPKQEEFIASAFDHSKTFVLFGGAIRGGKTFVALGTLILFCMKWPGSRWAIVRKDLPTIKRNTLPAWRKIQPTNAIKARNLETMTWTFLNGSEIIFFAENYTQDKEMNRWKGLEVNGFLFEEINECQEQSYYKAIERAGSYIIPGVPTHKQPPPRILATCNPTFGWVKEMFYTPWKTGKLASNMRYIQSTIFDNPYIPQPYIDSLKSLPIFQYKVFVMGDWDIQLKTGGEFWKHFEISDHLAPVNVDPEEGIHISVDNNVWPYISVSIWQIERKPDGEGWNIYQIHEICAKDPKNTATAAGREVLRYLKRIKYQVPKVYIYGDPTTKQRNTIDDNKKTFLDKFCDQISKRWTIQKRMFRKAPPVASTGEFINEIYRDEIFGITIKIGENCKESISDYIETKEDKDGGVLKQRIKDPKTGISFEKNGHLTDCKRYFIVKCFYTEYQRFVNRVSDPQRYHIAQPNVKIRGGI